MRRGLYPVTKEISLTNDLATLLAELAEADGASEAHIVRVALERLGLAYRRRGPAALKPRSYEQLHQKRRQRRSAAADAASVPVAAEVNQPDVKA
jgi:hypothetical protein